MPVNDGFCSDHLQRPNETISLSNHRLKKTGAIRVIVDRSAELADDIVNVLFGIDKKVRAPQLSDDLLARNELPAPSRQEDQQLHRFFLELDSTAGTPQFVTTEIQFNLACRPHSSTHKNSLQSPRDSMTCPDIKKIYKSEGTCIVKPEQVSKDAAHA